MFQLKETGVPGVGGPHAKSQGKRGDTGSATTLHPFMEEPSALVQARIQIQMAVQVNIQKGI